MINLVEKKIRSHLSFYGENSCIVISRNLFSLATSLVLCVCLVASDSLQLHGLQPTRLLCPWNLPGKNTGAGCDFLLQGIFLTQGSNPRLLHAMHWLLLLLSRFSHVITHRQTGSLPLTPPQKPPKFSYILPVY